MARRISVFLELAAAGYLAEAKAIQARTKQADDQIKALGRQVDATGHDMDQLAAQAAIAKRQVDDLGDEARGTATELKLLDKSAAGVKVEVAGVTGRTAEFEQKTHEAAAALKLLEARIISTKALVHDLGVEFAATGDKATGKELGSQRSLLGRMNRLRDELVASMQVVPEAAAAGVKAGSSFASSFGGILDGAGSPIKAGLIAGVLLAAAEVAPGLGAMLAGGITGAAGTGAIAAGIFSASKDEKVRHAAQAFGSSISAEFFAGGGAFVQPTIAALDLLQAKFQSLKLGDALAKAAPTVTTIAQGLGNLATNIMPGFNTAMDRLGPFANAAAEGFGELGSALGSFLDDVSASPGAVMGLEAAFKLVNGTIVILGNGIHWLSDVFAGFVQSQIAIYGAIENAARGLGLDDVADKAAKVKAAFEDIRDTAPPTIDALDGVGRTTMKVAESAQSAAWSTGELSAAWDEMNGKAMTADEALVSAYHAADEVGRAFREGGKSIDGATQAASENRLSLEHAAAAAAKAAEGYYKLTGDTAGANAMMDRFQAEAEGATGATGKQKDAVHRLADELFKLPNYVPVKIDVVTFYSTVGRVAAAAAKVIGGFGRAEGGPVGPGSYLVGEKQPEILTLGAGQYGHVYPSVGAWQAGSQGGWQASSMSSGGGGRMQLELTISPAAGSDARLMAAITDGLRFDIGTQSGGSVDVHLARGRR